MTSLVPKIFQFFTVKYMKTLGRRKRIERLFPLPRGFFKGKDEDKNEDKVLESRSLLTVFLNLFEIQSDPPTFYRGTKPIGVRKISRLTADAFEVEFEDRIDVSILHKAIKGEYAILEGERVGGVLRRFPPRIVFRGEIVAYVTRNLRGITVLLYPPPWQWTTYRRVLAALRGIKDLSGAFKANLEIIGIIEAYRLLRYGISGLEG